LSDSESVTKALSALHAGKLVAIPTETVYGLGADASNPLAIQAIYQLKGRPANHPLIVHVQAPLEHSQDKAHDWLAILSPRGGIAAPSANRFGKVSPSSAAHVRSEFIDQDDLLILDGGDCQFGIESTILDVSGDGEPRLLRPGSISPKQIKEATGINVSIDPIKDQKIPRVSGSLKAHYAPNTPLHLYKQRLSDFLQSIKQGRILDQSIALVVWEDESLHDLAQLKELTKKSKLIQVPKEPIAFAHGLYRLLRLLDQSQYQTIYIPSPPSGEGWARR